MKSIPIEKYPELKEAFPSQFVFFFDAHGNLNIQGKMAVEYLAMKRVLGKIEFVFCPEQEVMKINLGSFPVSSEARMSTLNEFAADFVEGCGLPEVSVRLEVEAQ